jgi:methylated-DNA-[protein]-cysteine S-methyltransferase
VRPTANSFTVESPVTTLAVAVENGVVTSILLGQQGQREPKGRLERQVASELQQYLSGRRREFTFPVGAEGTEFQRRVWRRLQQIPYGRTVTYGELARYIGNPKASRAVGTANGRNPVPIVIPCHRVVATGGKLGGYGGGLELKRRLLELESKHSSPLTLPGQQVGLEVVG